MEQGKSAKFEDVHNRLLQSIQNGDYLPGSRIPSETVLSERYNVSRNTLRQAIMILVKDGYLSNQQGRGTYVLKNIPEDSDSFQNISNPMVRCAKGKITRIDTDFEIQSFDVNLHKGFNLDASKLLIRLTNEYYIDDVCTGKAESWIPYDLLAESKVPMNSAKAINDFYEYIYERKDIKARLEIKIESNMFRIDEIFRDSRKRVVMAQTLTMDPRYYDLIIKQ